MVNILYPGVHLIDQLNINFVNIRIDDVIVGRQFRKYASTVELFTRDEKQQYLTLAYLCSSLPDERKSN